MKKGLSILAILISIGISASLPAAAEQSPWKPLFNGKDLSGWKQLNGKAKYQVENGMIVGISTANQPNSFLCTEKDYGDFILEYEMKISDNLNSGVQIRSESRQDYGNGRVHGYQVECETGTRAWTGGIYDEARRGWLYPLDRNPESRKAAIPGQWNKFRVEAIGNRIRTFVNGIACADLVDDMTAKGFIALQVHGIGGNKNLAGRKIWWRNIRIITDQPAKYASPENYSQYQVNLIPNNVSEKEKTQGYRLLWDGKTTRGWRGAKTAEFPKKGWKIENGELIVTPSGGAESAYGGDIVTTGKFKSFELKVDFKMTKGANSGIKYFVDPDLNKGAGSAIGCEFQILDDRHHPDAKLGVLGNRTAGSLYDLITASHPIGKRVSWTGWNQACVMVNGTHVEHWLNNMKVVEYERRNQMWRALVNYSKYQKWPAFGEAEEGNILLQDHGDEVHFRSVKIRELN